MKKFNMHVCFNNSYLLACASDFEMQKLANFEVSFQNDEAADEWS